MALAKAGVTGICIGATVSIQHLTVFPDDLRRMPVSASCLQDKATLSLNRQGDFNGIILIFVCFGFSLSAHRFWVKLQDVKRLLRNF